MRKWIIAASVLLVLGVAALVAVLNLNSLISRNKDYLLGQAEQALGRKVSVGEAKLTVFDGIGVRLMDFSLADDPAYASADFVRAKDIQINVKLWPLFKREFQVKKVILHRPVIQVIRNPNGEYNFATIGKKDKEERAAAESKKARRPPAEKDAGAAMLVSLVDISDGDVRYRDLKDGTDVRLQRIDLKVANLDFDKPVEAELAAALFATQPNIKIKARIGPLAAGADATRMPLDGQLHIDPLDLGKLKAAVPKVRSALPKDLDLGGVFRIKDLEFKGTLERLAFKGAVEGNDGNLGYGKTFHKAPGIPLSAAGDGHYANSTLFLRRMDLKLHTLALESKGEVRLGGDAELNLNFNSKPASLAGWEKIVPAIAAYQLSGEMQLNAALRGRLGHGGAPQVQGTLSLTGVSAKPPQLPNPIKELNAKIHFTGSKAEIRDANLNLGRSRVRLAAAIEKFSPLTLSYKVSTPEVWPADFAPKLSEERKGDVIKNLASEGQVAVREGGIGVQAKLISGQGTMYKVGYKNFEANLSLADGVATIRNLRATAMGGAIQADGEYAFKDSAPRFSLVSKLQGVDVKQLYGALSPKAEQDVRGSLNGDMKFSGNGQRWEELRQTLRGQGEAEVVHGALLNFNVADGAMSGVAGMPGLANIINPRLRKKYPEIFEAKDTEFKEMKAVFELADARVNVKSLRVVATDYAVQGAGMVDLDRRINLRSALFLSERLSRDVGEAVREMRYLLNPQNQIEIPFTISGRLPNVKPKPDMSYIGRMVQRGFMHRGVEELQRRYLGRGEPASPEESEPADSKKRKRGSVEDAIRKGLEGLFKR